MHDPIVGVRGVIVSQLVVIPERDGGILLFKSKQHLHGGFMRGGLHESHASHGDRVDLIVGAGAHVPFLNDGWEFS